MSKYKLASYDYDDFKGLRKYYYRFGETYKM